MLRIRPKWIKSIRISSEWDMIHSLTNKSMINLIKWSTKSNNQRRNSYNLNLLILRFKLRTIEYLMRNNFRSIIDYLLFVVQFINAN